MSAFPGTASAAAPERERVCAVVVTYHPDSGLTSRVAATAAQVGAVVAVDNGSGPAGAAVLDALAAARPETVIERNAENLGLAAALNQGLRHAEAAGFAWALLLDQDSEPRPEMLESLRAAWAAFPEPARLGLIGSRHEVALAGAPAGLPARAEESLPPGGAAAYRKRENVITSGTLLSLAACRQAGPMREDFFIDAVDFEYCLRLRRRGFAVIEAAGVGLRHPIGEPTMRRVLGRRLIVTNHSPLRRYYITRNRLRLAAEYFFSLRAWGARDLVRLSKEMLVLLLAERDRPRKFGAAALGALHAAIGRGGRLRRPPRWLLPREERKAA